MSPITGLLLVSLLTACGTMGGAAVGATFDAAIGAGTGYGAGNGALISTGGGAAVGANYDSMKKLTLGVMKIWAVRLGIATPPLLWSGALGQGATPRMVKGQIIVGAVVLLVFIASSPAVRAPPFAGSVLLADGRSKAMLHLEDDAVGVVSTRVKGDLQRFKEFVACAAAIPERGAARSSKQGQERPRGRPHTAWCGQVPAALNGIGARG